MGSEMCIRDRSCLVSRAWLAVTTRAWLAERLAATAAPSLLGLHPRVADGAVAAFREPSALDRPCDTLSPQPYCFGSREMWTGEKIIFVEYAQFVPFFMEMALDTIEFATDDYFFYATSTSLACLVVGTLRMRDSMPHVARVGGARTVDTERTPSMGNQMYVQRRMYRSPSARATICRATKLRYDRKKGPYGMPWLLKQKDVFTWPDELDSTCFT